jgi:hypothetical protein
MKIPQCPRCGDGENSVYVNAQARGHVTLWYDSETGKETEANFDDVYTVRVGIVRCGRCQKVRSDLYLSGFEIKQKDVDLGPVSTEMVLPVEQAEKANA